MIIAGVSLAAIVCMILAWPSSPKTPVRAEPLAKVTSLEPAAPAPPPRVEARLVEPELKPQTKVAKLQVKSTVRKTPRRARR